MNAHITLIVAIVLSLSLTSACQSLSHKKPHFDWPEGQKAALALTYDDAMDSQLDEAVPTLEAYGFKGTFYLSQKFNNFENRKSEWAGIAAQGHELGNHTVVHPCQASKTGRVWVSSDRDLDLYSQDQLLNEIKAANVVLNEMDGQTKRSYAYTCGDVLVGGQSYREALKPLFSGARSVTKETPYDPYFIPSLAVDQTLAEEMIDYVDSLIATGRFGTITFHGIGAEHLSVSVEAHRQLIAYLATRQDDIWVAPLHEIVSYIESRDK